MEALMMTHLSKFAAWPLSSSFITRSSLATTFIALTLCTGGTSSCSDLSESPSSSLHQNYLTNVSIKPVNDKKLRLQGSSGKPVDNYWRQDMAAQYTLEEWFGKSIRMTPPELDTVVKLENFARSSWREAHRSMQFPSPNVLAAYTLENLEAIVLKGQMTDLSPLIALKDARALKELNLSEMYVGPYEVKKLDFVENYEKSRNFKLYLPALSSLQKPYRKTHPCPLKRRSSWCVTGLFQGIGRNFTLNLPPRGLLFH